MIIDIHTHVFPDRISASVLEKLSDLSRTRYYTDATENGLLRSMERAGIDRSVTLPVVTKASSTPHINDGALQRLETAPSDGIIPFGGIHPEYEDYADELRRLARGGIRGIKLHPCYQGLDLTDLRFKRLIGAASAEGLAVVIHAGDDIGYPEHNFASVPMILELLDDVRPEKLILAHMGGWQGWADVERDLAGAPVWLDTSFSLGPIVPKPGMEALQPWHSNMAAEDFVRLCRRHGTERILFGTDSPWADQAESVAQLRTCGLTDAELTGILGENARSLLNLS